MRTGFFLLAGVMFAQTPTISLQDALARAKQYGGQIQTASLAALSAREDRAQARANTLPSVSALNQFIYTEGNGTPSGVFVANDGVHVYNEQAVVHQDLFVALSGAAILVGDGCGGDREGQNRGRGARVERYRDPGLLRDCGGAEEVWKFADQ